MIEIKLLGNPMISDMKARIISNGRSTKTWEILILFMYNKDSSYSLEKVFECIWGKSSIITNPTNTVKMAIHRTRDYFSALGEELITFENGQYRWNTVISYRLDTDEFERLALSDSLRQKEKALSLYDGDFLGTHSSPLIDTYKEKFHIIYLEALNDVLNGLENTGEYSQAISYIAKGLEIEKLDERIYLHKLKSLSALERYEEVLTTYEELYRVSKAHNIPVSDESRLIYKVAAGKSGPVTTIDTIIDELTEKSDVTGCYIAEYSELRQICHFYHNNRIPSYLLLLNFNDISKNTLISMIKSVTGSMDIAAIPGPNQAAVMLPFTTEYECKNILNSIDSLSAEASVLSYIIQDINNTI